jgi:hypothetical protein
MPTTNVNRTIAAVNQEVGPFYKEFKLYVALEVHCMKNIFETTNSQQGE